MDEELVEILGNAELDDTSKAEAIKGIVGKSFIPTTKFKEEKTKQVQMYNALKTEFDSFKETKMTDEEKQEEFIKAQAEDYKKVRKQLNEMTVKNIFSDAGFKQEDYKGFLDSIVQEDSEKTKNIAETICNSMLKQRQEIEKQIKDNIIKGTKTPPTGNDNGQGTTSDIDNLKKLYADAMSKNDIAKVAYYTRLIQQEQFKNEE